MWFNNGQQLDNAPHKPCVPDKEMLRLKKQKHIYNIFINNELYAFILRSTFIILHFFFLIYNIFFIK